MSKIDKRLEELGIELPESITPLFSYVPVQQTGNLLYLSGAGPTKNGELMYEGKLGEKYSVEDGQQAARLCGLNLLANLKNYLGDLDKVKKIVKVNGYVACATDFYQQPAVINGCSDLLVEVFGDNGKHARCAVGAPALPRNFAVEIELIVEIN